MKTTRFLVLAVAAAATVISDAAPAEACGGCFTPPLPAAEASVVTDHRMALSISPQQTILWDQIRYSGNPDEFAWVLPVRTGAKIEVANDEFFTALDTSTQPLVYPPARFNTAAGCALTGCASEDNSAGAEANGGKVDVLSQSVVGPYEQVTLRATDEGALTKWLRTHNFTIPATIEPTITQYVQEGFDFIALRLRPTCGERAMRPVRVITPGANPTLPLRMVAAGIGPKVGIILYVITEGRYQPQNFPHTVIEDSKLRWDRNASKSNYEPLSQDLMSQDNGRTWITEYADKPTIPLVGTGWQTPAQPPISYSFSNYSNAAQTRRASTGLADTYYGLCKEWVGSSSRFNLGSSSSSGAVTSSSSGGVSFTPCPETDSGTNQTRPVDAGHVDAGESDASSDAGPATDAGDAIDAGDAGDAGNGVGGQGDDDDSGDTPPTTSKGNATGNPRTDCAYLDDLDHALDGLNRGEVWVTRLRSILPANTLGTDLFLEPTKLSDGRADTTPVSNLHWTPYYTDDPAPESTKGDCAGAPQRRRPYTAWGVTICGLAFAAAWLRRRRRPK